MVVDYFFFFFQAEDGIRDVAVTGVQTCALPISPGQRRPAGASFFLPRTGCGVRSITRGKNGDDNEEDVENARGHARARGDGRRGQGTGPEVDSASGPAGRSRAGSRAAAEAGPER